MYKKLVFSILLIGVSFIFVAILSTSTEYVDLNNFLSKYQANKNDKNKNSAEQADYEMELFNKFLGEYVYYTNKVIEVTRLRNKYVIHIYNKEVNKIRCYLDVDDWKEVVYKLKQEQLIKIRGKFYDFFLGISIKNCEIILGNNLK